MQENKDNFLLGVRGNALTHDVELGRSTLESLLKLNEGAESELKVPRYDKSAYEGKGDRADKAEWPVIKAPVDVILFEGWMLGFTPVADETASQVRQESFLLPLLQHLVLRVGIGLTGLLSALSTTCQEEQFEESF